MRSRFLIPVVSTVWMLGCGRLPAGATLEPVPGGRPSVPPVAPGKMPSGQVVADFASFETGGWQNLTFRPWHRKVDYRMDTGSDGQAVIRATSDDAASMLVRLSSIDVRKTPILRWSWCVTGPVPGSAIAFMTDTDQTHGRMVSWYGPVRAFQEWPAP